MAKSLNDILAGKKSSKVSPPDIDAKNLYQWNAEDGVKFIKKHEIETHDYPHDAEAAFKGKKGGMDKTSKYKFQKDGVYEETDLDEKYMGFEKLKRSIAAKGDVRDPAAVAAAIGRKKYGKKKFQAAAAAGKKLGEGLQCNHTMEGEYCPMHEKKACPSEDDVNMQKKPKKDEKGREYLTDKKKCMEEAIMNEVAPPSPKLEKWIKDNKQRFVKEYGKEKGMQVLYAKAWKMHGQSESGTSSPATNTDYAGPGAAGWTTGRLDVGTL